MKNIDIKGNMKNYTEDALALLSSIVYSVLFLFRSPLNPWMRGESGTDSSVFKTIALMMEKGYMPYKDSFDHKGPFLYILNYLGNRISFYSGIWVIEVIFLTVTGFYLYKIARLSCGKMSSAISVMIATTLLFEYFEGGNLTEEYAMPCIAYSLYVFIDYFVNGNIFRRRLILSGISMGIVLMLRPNMIAVWLVFCTYIFIKLLLLKEFKELYRIIICFVFGIMIIILPIMVWLVVNNDLSQFLFDYIIFNKQYSSAAGGRAVFSAQLAAFKHFTKTTVYIVSILYLAFHSVRYTINRVANISYLYVYMGFMIITVILMVISGMQYGHYGMVIVPTVVYPLSLMLKYIEDMRKPNIRYIAYTIVIVCLCRTLFLKGGIEIPNSIAVPDEKNANVITLDEKMSNILSYINEYTDDSQPISVYGNYDFIYVMSNRRHATKYSYQFPIGEVMPQIMDEYFKQLQDELPNIIVVKHHDDRIHDFILQNEYLLQWKEDSTEDECLELYLRKS